MMENGTRTIDPQNLHLPQSPPVDAIRVAEVIDSLGDPAFRVWVVLREPIADEERSWRRVRPIEDEIRQFLRQQYGSERFPYFSFLTPTELKLESIG